MNRALNTCGGTPYAAAVDVTAFGTPDDPVGIDNCPVLCGKFVTACKGAADASAACWKKAIAKFAAVQAAICNVQSGAAQDACKDTLIAEKAAAKDEAENGQEQGRSYCETTGLFSCTVSCNCRACCVEIVSGPPRSSGPGSIPTSVP